jgi:demethylmenaquinone methyltransferase / 2-methoxy-6-polyprenyl-1,4-benzoquinol methylase
MAGASAKGTTPRGTQGEVQAAGWVRQMFGAIAPRYDLANHLLSLNIDRGWRRKLRAELEPVLERPEARVLDLCCGTGDVLLALRKGARATVLGGDFSHPMLVEAQRKAESGGLAARLFEGDALALPLADASLDAISIAFGFRNLANYDAGLSEFARVLKPGGKLVILEFSHPPGAMMRSAYGLYLRHILPLIGALVSGSREAYAYLPESIGKFPKPGELKQMMETSGFGEVRYQLLTGGIAALHTGVNSALRGVRNAPVDLLAQV